MTQALAEGWELMEKAPEVFDSSGVMRSWQSGTVIRSWLLELAVLALKNDEHLERLRGYAPDSDEGRWTVECSNRVSSACARNRCVTIRQIQLAAG